MPYHPKADEIARLGGGALIPRQAAQISSHVDGCARCRKTRDRVTAVRQLLTAASYPAMPDLVASEIELAIAIEISHRNVRKSGILRHAFEDERSHGVARSAAGVARLPHVAWAYRDKDELAARVLEYAEEGIAAGQYVELVGLGGIAELDRHSSHVARRRTVRQALETGRAAVRDIADFYQLDGQVVDAKASVARRVAAVESAAEAGLHGSRIIVDCTPVTRTARQREAHAEYEHLLDRQILARPIVALCAYNARDLRLGALAELACMHPYTSPRAAPFLLYAEQNATLGLAGTLSDGSTPLFAAALRRIGMASESEVVIDARSAQYICQPAVGALIARVQELNVTAVLRVSGPHSASLTSTYPGLTIERALSSRCPGARGPLSDCSGSTCWRDSMLELSPLLGKHPVSG